MSPSKTPMQKVNEDHGGKEKLVDRILGLIERAEEGESDLKQRLLAVSNRKLLRLAETWQVVKDKYGSKDKLTEAVAQALGRAKDADYVRKLGEYTPGRLLDMARQLAAEGGEKIAAAAKPVKEKVEKAASKAKAKVKAAKPAKG